MPPASRSRAADEQRQARLDARLALYAQYASLVGDEIAAAWSDDPHEAGTTAREIARARAALAEQYEELRASSADDAAATSPDGFGELLADAVTELDHQSAVERALRAQLERLRGGPALLGAGEPVEAVETPAPSPSGTAETDPPASDPSVGEEPAGPPIGAALLAARSSGVGGVLGGRYPGVAAGADAGGYAADGPTSEADVPAGRLDVRF